jgi:aminoglycoside 3'-phosphotransferase-2
MSTAFDGSPAFPARLSALADFPRQRVTLGESGASVWRIEGSGETLFLKAAPEHALSEMPGEVERLSWLRPAPVPAPRLRDSFAADGQDWLLMTALPGRDLTQLVDRPEELVAILATGLHALHGLDPQTCPFDHRIEARLEAGAANIAADLVDETDFDDAFVDWKATDILAWLHAHRPDGEDLVVTHGDACLPNIMADAAGFSGIIDCGRLGVADRWQDLALACRSLAFNCGEPYVAAFLEAYGAEWDAERYAFYCALDELF